jgi:hypothetical protein
MIAMTIVASYDWESDSWTHNGDNPARLAFRSAVAEVAIKAKATLPECNGRVDSAVKIVLNGDVELLADGKAKVASQSNGTTQYFVVNGTCECRDFPKAPSGWCKHRIAAGLHKRAVALAHTPLDADPTAAEAAHAAHPLLPAPAPAPDVPAALPEAPASVNCYVTLGGRQVQVTLRGTDELAVLARLEVVLARYPVAQACTTPPAPPAPTSAPAVVEAVPTCSQHGTSLKASTKRPGSWYCPVKDTTGKYCAERR